MEEVITTKQKIIYESLKLFSEKGYDGVSMREIAAAVGIKGASIYNHFKGKEDIFTAIFEQMTKLYDVEVAISLQLSAPPEDLAKQTFFTIEENKLQEMAEYIFSFFTLNEFVVMFRKLIVTEQHKSLIAAKCYREYYLEAPVKFQKQIFEGIQSQGGFKEYDASLMALHFYSPIFYILCKYDAGFSYEVCLQELKKHVHGFCVSYMK